MEIVQLATLHQANILVKENCLEPSAQYVIVKEKILVDVILMVSVYANLVIQEMIATRLNVIMINVNALMILLVTQTDNVYVLNTFLVLIVKHATVKITEGTVTLIIIMLLVNALETGIPKNFVNHVKNAGLGITVILIHATTHLAIVKMEESVTKMVHVLVKETGGEKTVPHVIVKMEEPVTQMALVIVKKTGPVKIAQRVLIVRKVLSCVQ
jgi:hypothetical protein